MSHRGGADSVLGTSPHFESMVVRLLTHVFLVVYPQFASCALIDGRTPAPCFCIPAMR